MQAKITFSFTANLWKYPGKGGWYFVSLPLHISKEIKENLVWQEQGWGRMTVDAEVNNISWQTAIWYDKKHQTYLLPLKAEIRKKLGLITDMSVSVIIKV